MVYLGTQSHSSSPNNGSNSNSNGMNNSSDKDKDGGADQSSGGEDEREGRIRVGKDYQATTPAFIAPDRKNL